jgi:hypothetical protein
VPIVASDPVIYTVTATGRRGHDKIATERSLVSLFSVFSVFFIFKNND